MDESFRAKRCQQIADGEKNPFWTLEALGEHLGAIWGAWGRLGYEIPKVERGQRVSNAKPGELPYHLLAAEKYAKDLLNTMAAIEPLLYEASEGDKGALLLLQDHLQSLKAKHQHDWDEIQSNFD